jgi:hypothetical protein
MMESMRLAETVALTLSALITCSTLPASATETERTRATDAYVIFGVGTPVGELGLELSHRFGSTFELAAGVGLGDYARAFRDDDPSKRPPSTLSSLQWSVMPRWRWGSSEQAFTVGVGISAGNFAYTPLFCDENGRGCVFWSGYLAWVNLEIGGEHRLGYGVSLRYFAGLARDVALIHDDNLKGPAEHAFFPYFGAGLGYAF